MNKKDTFAYKLKYAPRSLLSPIPLGLIQPLLKHIVIFVTEARPELFARLGIHKDTIFVIDPINMPFVLKLEPNPENPSLTAHRHHENIEHGAKISGTFLNLLKMIDGNLDGDALFFSRDLKIEGNTEAVVCLRNAMDDLEGSIVDDVTASLGAFNKPINKLMSFLVRRNS